MWHGFVCPPCASACHSRYTPPRPLVAAVDKRNATRCPNRLGRAAQSGTDGHTPAPAQWRAAPHGERSRGAASVEPRQSSASAGGTRPGCEAPREVAERRAAARLPSAASTATSNARGVWERARRGPSYLFSRSVLPGGKSRWLPPARGAAAAAAQPVGCRPMAARLPPLTGAPQRRAPAPVSAPASSEALPEPRPSPLN